LGTRSRFLFRVRTGVECRPRGEINEAQTILEVVLEGRYPNLPDVLVERSPQFT